MSNRLTEILEEIRELEKSVQEEMKRKEEELNYRVRKGMVIFEKEISEMHKKFSSSLFRYIAGASLPTILSAPVIYAMFLPTLLLDLCLFVYQAICFPVYGIPRVRRRDHIVLDRHYLKYLNFLERLNCDYCSYFNGLSSYATEIAARTEQYWCPIKHASGKAARHSRYHLFFDYGDARAYKTKLAEIRKKYEDAD
jgi:hypothetical protein